MSEQHWNVSAHPVRWTSAWAWFGPFVGGSLWMMLTAGVIAAYGQPGLSVVPAVCFLVVVAVTTVLWRLRSRISAPVAMMWALTVLAIVTPLILATITLYASDEVRVQLSWPPSPFWHAMAYLVVPLCVLVLAVRQRKLFIRRTG